MKQKNYVGGTLCVDFCINNKRGERYNITLQYNDQIIWVGHN